MDRIELLRFVERKSLLLYRACAANLNRLSVHGSAVSDGWQLGNIHVAGLLSASRII